MNKLVLVFLLFFTSATVFSQEQSAITVSFDNVSLKEALVKLEKESGYQFYFQEDWLSNAKPVSGNFSKVSLKEILETILEASNLNFLVQDTSVIFTKNSLIYSKLPADYFNEDRKQINKDASPPRPDV